MIRVSAITKIEEVLPFVWNIVFECNESPFEYTTDLMFLHQTNTWVISRRIPHELTSLLEHGTCPLCHHNGISCQVATKQVETIIQSVLNHPLFQEKTSEKINRATDDLFTKYQFVKDKKEWSELYHHN